MSEVAETLRRLGGVATWGELRVTHSRRAVLRARDEGAVVCQARGRYHLPEAPHQLALAHRRSAVLSHLSAAVHHGWKVKTPPELAWVTVSDNRHLRAHHREGLVPHWLDLGEGDVADGVTRPLRTVLDCARALPFDAGLAVADSALRAGAVTRAELHHAAAEARGPRSRAVRTVVAHADGRAANPFESVLRALTLLEGFDLTPQLQITDSGLFAVVDLGSEALQLAVEADGFEHHGTRAGLRKDCRRHTELSVFGWSSLRFAYEDAMVEPAWTRWALRSWRQTRRGQVPGAPPRRGAAAS